LLGSPCQSVVRRLSSGVATGMHTATITTLQVSAMNTGCCAGNLSVSLAGFGFTVLR
jgi:hypothetical protein